ncbi:MAG: HD domain-containing protein [Candidatus Fermentibacteria bacterium]
MLFSLFRQNGEELYLVGGYVRDRLLGRETGDYDFTTSARPDITKEILESNGFRVFPIGMEFGTVAAVLESDSGSVEIQITTYRCAESYRKGSRHPEVVFGNDLEEDLVRRDFTVNAIAMDESGSIIDPLGGVEDLRCKIIRTPMSPEETFSEDPLRMLRAFRFACRLGFSIRGKTLEAIERQHHHIIDISRERWKMEMDSLLTAEDGAEVSRVLQLMKDTEILQDMIPRLGEMFMLDGMTQGKAHYGDIWEHTLDVVKRTKNTAPCLRWAALLHDIGKPPCRTVDEDGNTHFYGHEKTGADFAGETAESFRFSKKEKKCLSFLVKNHMRPVLYSSEWSDRAVRKLAAESGEYLELLLDLAAADIAAHAEPYCIDGAARMAELRRRLRILTPDVRRRVLPGDLGRILSKRADGGPSSETGVILGNLEELVHQGILPPMASPEVYLEYLAEHPELKLKQHI